MNTYEVVKLMEEKKEVRIEEGSRYKERDIVKEIKKEIEKFKRKKSKDIFLYYGLRGIGKSIALAQGMRKDEGMFIDGSILSYYDIDMVKVIKEYQRIKKYKILYIDEVNEIKNWGKALKIIHDNFNIKIIATGSSAIKVSTQSSMIKRRSRIIEVSPLSFREFLRIKKGMEIKERTKDIFLSKPEDAYIKAKGVLINLPDLVQEFREFMKGGFPLAFDRRIKEVSESIIEKILVDDFPAISGFNLEIISKAKRLIEFLALSKPEVISLRKFSDVGGLSRTTVSSVLDAFVVSSLLIPVLPAKSGGTKLRKEKKYLFASPPLRYGIQERFGEEEKGGLREDAFVSSAHYSGIKIGYLQERKKHGDYLIYGYRKNKVEIGGSGKGTKQIEKGLILKDSEEIDYKDGCAILPLFLSGLML